MKNQPEFFYYEQPHHSDEEEEKELTRKSFPGIRIGIASLLAIFLLLMLNDVMIKTSQVKGVVTSFGFLKGEWVGPPSILREGPNLASPFTYYRQGSYELMIRLDSGSLVKVLCFKCNSASYRPGDTIEIRKEVRFFGKDRYKENSSGPK